MEDQYLKLLAQILHTGTVSKDRTGVGTVSSFHNTIRCDLKTGFPILTTKKIHLKSIIYELLWYISGNTNIKYLQNNGVRIWNEWADEKGDLGKVYGYQLRNYQGIHDQLTTTIEEMTKNPYGRRHIITLWNPVDLPSMALPPCHGIVIQFYIRDNKLSCAMYQRSADMFLGVPFNISLYALLTHMIAQILNLIPNELIITFGDTHIYQNHFSQVKEQLLRKKYPLPKIELNTDIKNIDDFKYEDFKLIDYKYHPSIKAEVAI